MQAKAKPEAQLGDSEAKAMSLGRLWQEATKAPNPSYSIYSTYSIYSIYPPL